MEEVQYQKNRTLNLSCRSSDSSVRMTSSVVTIHCRDYTVQVPLSKPALPPTSRSNKTATIPSGTRTSTSSVGSIFSVDTTLSDGVPRRPSKLGRPSRGGFRDSSGSSENSIFSKTNYDIAWE